MSNVIIMRAVDNIRSGTNVYTPLVEVVVNAIQAIEETGRSDGRVVISVNRSVQGELDGGLSDVSGFTVSDNGIGFTEENRAAFDTLYTIRKIEEGGKGFGRFTCLKYFEDVYIESVFMTFDGPMRRSFQMGKLTELIENETVAPAEDAQAGTTVDLVGTKATLPDKTIPIIARILVERLLPFFISEEKVCPRVFLQESDGSERIALNDYIGGVSDPLIVEVREARGGFALDGVEGQKEFTARVFKLYSPRTKRSRVSLVAHRREVTGTSLHQFIPEFSEEFFDQIVIDGQPTDRNFVVAVYVFGDYLDEHVSIERGGFEFHRESDALRGIAQRDIEQAAAQLGRHAVEGEVRHRRERKEQRIRDYVRDKAPWHATVVREADLSGVPYGATEEEIDVYLHREKHVREVRTRQDVSRLLASKGEPELDEKAADIVRAISESSRSELVHYVALRRSVLDIFERSLEVDEDGKYRSEHVVHDVIFPRKGDTDRTKFEDHNLWILDERLNFMEYTSSDIPLAEIGSDRPDLLAFGRRVSFRGANEASNPVIIFEFKKPQRDDFANPASKEDPIEQIIRYVRQIREGKYRTPKGREFLVSETTPFYGYVVCDLTSKVRGWVELEKNFTPMPDRMGYFHWHGSLNLYLEVLGWDKVLKSATERNRVFFQKLGIE